MNNRNLKWPILGLCFGTFGASFLTAMIIVAIKSDYPKDTIILFTSMLIISAIIVIIVAGYLSTLLSRAYGIIKVKDPIFNSLNDKYRLTEFIETEIIPITLYRVANKRIIKEQFQRCHQRKKQGERIKFITNRKRNVLIILCEEGVSVCEFNPIGAFFDFFTSAKTVGTEFAVKIIFTTTESS